MIAQHLSEATALINRGEFQAAIHEHLDRVLLIDPSHAGAAELKLRAEDLQRAAGPSAAPEAPPVPTAPVTPAPAAAASTGPTPTSARGTATARSESPDPPPAVAARRTVAAPRRMAEATVEPPPPDVARRIGESPAAWRDRAQQIAQRYGEGRAALESGAFEHAGDLLESVSREEPGYRDVDALIARTRAELERAANRAPADGARLEEQGDFAGALKEYEQAARLAPRLEGLEPAVARLHERMRAAARTP